MAVEVARSVWAGFDTREAFGIETARARKASTRAFPAYRDARQAQGGRQPGTRRQYRVTFTGGHSLEYGSRRVRGGVRTDAWRKPKLRRRTRR